MGIQKDSVRDQVRRTLTERILAGHYKPGDRLVELQIARELGTSQGSVREALRELEASRLVESEPRRGTRVRVVSLKELQDAYFARGILEQAAAATAAKAFKGNVEKLRQEFQGILDAAEARDLGEQAAHVYALHRMIVEASGNCVLLRLWESLAFETRARVRLGGRRSIWSKSRHPTKRSSQHWKRATPGRLHACCRNTPRPSRRPRRLRPRDNKAGYSPAISSIGEHNRVGVSPWPAKNQSSPRRQ